MSKFVLTAQLQLQAPNNTPQVLNKVQRQLRGVTIPVSVKGAEQAQVQIKKITQATQKASSAAEAMGKSFGLAIKRFAAFTVASRAVSLFTNSLSKAVDEAISFQREVIKISQVTGRSVKELKGLRDTIDSLSTGLGVSSQELLSTARILSQAGVKANDLNVALTALAKTTLAPTFDDITQTAEGAVAILAQFEQGVGSLEKQLGAINRVSGQFAVESGDLISAVRRFGGVFKSAGGDLNELLALFTSVRATTRESSESIATGLRTIFTRIQRPKTIEFLRQFGVELLNAEGKFVGPIKAVEQLNKAFAGLDQGDITFVRVAEELGGFRQIGKVIPLIQQYGVAVEALAEAKKGENSLSEDAATAQQALAVQITKVKEEFLALVRSVAESNSFQLFTRTALELASALIKVADALKPLIPLIGALAAFKFARGLGGFAASAGSAIKGLGKNQGGVIQQFARGGFVPGQGNRDTVPAMLTPGEFVIKKSSAKKLGAGTLQAMNENRFNEGTTGRGVPDPKRRRFGSKTDGASKVYFGVKKDQIGAFFMNPAGTSDPKSYSANGDFEFPLTNLNIRKATGAKQDLKQKVTGVLKAGSYPTFFPSLKDAEKGLGPDFVNPAVASGISSLTKSVTEKIKKSNLLDIAPVIDSDETLLSGIDQQVGSDKGLISTIAGYVFEGVITAITGAKTAGGNASFDFPASSLRGNRKKLGALFGNESLIKKLAKADAKATSGADKFNVNKPKGTIPNKVANDINAGILSGVQILKGAKSDPDDLTKSRTAVFDEKTKGFGPSAPITKNKGGGIGGSGDTVPALLTPGEFVVNKKAAQSIGYGNLNSMNKTGVARFNKGGAVQTFSDGGVSKKVVTNKDTKQAVTGEGFSADKLILFTTAAGFAQTALQKFGDTSKQASDTQAKTTIALQKLISASLVLFAGYSYAIKPLLDFTNKVKEASKQKISEAEKDVKSSKKIESQIRGQLDLKKQSKETADTNLTKAQADSTTSLRQQRRSQEVLKKAQAEEKRANKQFGRPGRDIYADAEKLNKAIEKRSKAERRLEDANKRVLQSNQKITQAQKAADRANKKLVGARNALNRQTYKTIQAENKLAKQRLKGFGAQAAGGATKALGIVGAVAVLGNQIASGFEQWFKRAEEQAKASDNIAGAIEAAGNASIASSIGELFTIQGFIEAAFVDSEGFVKKRAQKKEQAEFQSAFGFIESRRSSSAEEIKGGRDVGEALSGVNEAFARARAEAQDLTGPARDKAIKAVDSATRAEIGRLDKLGVSVDVLRQQAINLTGGQEDLRKELLAQVDAIEANRKAQQELNKANLDATKITSAFGAAANASAQLVAGLETGANSLALLSQELDNASGKLGVDATDAINQSKAALLSSLPAGSPLAASVSGQADVAIATNKFGINAAAQLGDLEFASGDAGKQQLEQALFDAIPDKADDATKAKLEAIIRKNIAGIKGDVENVDLNALTQQILADGQELSKGFREAVKLQSQHNATMTTLYAKREQLEQKAAEAANQAIETQLEAAKVFESFGGSKLTGEQQLEARIAQFNNIGGLGGLGARLTTGNAADIRAIGEQIGKTFANQTDQVIGGAFAGAVGLQKGGPFQGAGGFAADQRPEAQAANKALIQFTKQRISLLKEELSIVQKKNAAEKSALEKLISGDVEGFLDQQAAAGAGAALASGSAGLAGLFSASALGAGFKTLEGQGLSDQQLRRAEDLTLQRFGIQGTGVLSGTTAQEEAIKSQGRELAGVLGELSQQEAAFAKAEISVQDAIISASNISFARKLDEVSRNNIGAGTGQQELARGGMVYASKGMFIPRGTDTVPAMLTPGEFVVNRSAVNRGNNLEILRAMNSGGGASAPGAMSGGGQVRYYNFGGLVDGITNAFSNSLPQLTTVFSGFAETVEKLLNTKFNVALDPTNVNINFNGGSFLENLTSNLRDEVLDMVSSEIGKYKSNNSGDLVKKDSVL